MADKVQKVDRSIVEILEEGIASRNDLPVMPRSGRDPVIQAIWRDTEELLPKAGKLMPVRRAAVLIAFSQNGRLDFDEWRGGLKISLGQGTSEESQCVCSQDIDYSFVISNRFNHHQLILGSSCIELFDDPLITGQLKHLQYVAKGGTKRQCISCKKHCIAEDDPHWKKQCFSCWKKRSGYGITK